MTRLFRIGVLALVLGFLTACGQQEPVSDSFEPQLLEALTLAGQDRTAIILPKVPYPVSKPAWLALVDKSLRDPPSMIGLSRKLLEADSDASRSAYTSRLLTLLDPHGSIPPEMPAPAARSMSAELDRLGAADASGTRPGTPPADWSSDAAFAAALRTLLYGAAEAGRAWTEAFANPTPEMLSPVRDLIVATLEYQGKAADKYRPLDAAYHALGARQDTAALALALVRLLAVVEHGLPALQQAPVAAGEWATPLGRVKIAGMGDDTHSGEYLLLIDPGGNDRYENVTAPLEPGAVSIIIDLAGNDTVRWDKTAGPGAGLLGLGLWVDMAGDDRYTGGHLGLGAGLLGAGLFWDVAGNDIYDAQALSAGVGQYGIGILFDDRGNDRYRSIFNGQGYGGSGGFGVLVDLDGSDDYFCGGAIADPVKKRVIRHRATHFLSLCQGFGFGLRPDISGGIGLLLDRKGNDHYKADIFAQGAAYWFGLGMLVDGTGDDRYEGFEHVQGEGLHLSAGVLSDWGGNDQYSGYEHAQGVGKDRGAGVLFDAAGNDAYQSFRESQGAGLASYGIGLLVDVDGDDHYKAKTDSQGYSGRPERGFPEKEWPTGILLDLGGTDIFDQPYVDDVTSAGRVQNRQGVAIRYGVQQQKP